MEFQSSDEPFLPQFVPPFRKDPKQPTSTAFVAKILSDIHLKVREGERILSVPSVDAEEEGEATEAPEEPLTPDYPSEPLPRPDGLTKEQAARLLPAYIIPVSALPEKTTKTRVVNEWSYFGRTCITIADDFGFTAVLPNYNNNLSLRTSTQSNVPGVYVVTVRQGDFNIVLHVPRFYCETHKIWYVDLEADTVTIEWVPDTRDEDAICLRPPRNALNYRIDFDEDSEVDAESIAEGENGKPIVQAPQDFGYMAQGDYLYNPFSNGDPNTKKEMTKEEKKLLQKTLNHSTTKELAIASRKAKEQRKYYEALKKDQEKAEGAPLLLLSKGPKQQKDYNGTPTLSKRQRRRAKETARNKAKLAQKEARKQAIQAATDKDVSSPEAITAASQKPFAGIRRRLSSISGFLPANKKQKLRKSSVTKEHALDIPLDTLPPVSPSEYTMSGALQTAAPLFIPTILPAGPSAIPPPPKLKTIKKTLKDTEKIDIRGLVSTGFLNFTPSEVRQVTTEEDRAPDPMNRPAKLVARDEIVMSRVRDGRSRLRTVSDIAVPSSAAISNVRERSHTDAPMPIRAPEEPVEIDVDGQGAVDTYLGAISVSEQDAENIPLAEIKRPFRCHTRSARAVTFATHLEVPERHDGYQREVSRPGRPIGEALPITGFGRKKSNTYSSASRQD